MKGKAEQGVRQGQGTEKAEYRATVQVMTRKKRDNEVRSKRRSEKASAGQVSVIG